VGRMPVLFVGHGSPMNAIEDNRYTRKWIEIGAAIPQPAAILAISAHWTTDGIHVADSARPRTVYDMYGFPREMYEVAYQPPGSPEYARRVADLIENVRIDNSWGIDHGTWSVLNHLYPKADIPVFQLSLDWNAPRQDHFELGQMIKPLREAGVLIMGSGNIVHNLSLVNWEMAGGYPWAVEFDGYIRECVIKGKYHDVIDYKSAGPSAQSAFRTTEHFDPLLYVLGAADSSDRLSIMNDSCTMGSLSMTCYLFQ
jgi:4,5-DOPA dioxygenase extradiol